MCNLALKCLPILTNVMGLMLTIGFLIFSLISAVLPVYGTMNEVNKAKYNVLHLGWGNLLNNF